MDYINQLSVKTRMCLSFGVVLALMILLTIIGINKVNFISNKLSEITEINAVKQRYAINFRGSVHDRAISIRDVSKARTDSEINTFVEEIRELESFYKESDKNMQSMMSSGVVFSNEEKQILDDIADIRKETLLLVEQVIEQKRAGQSTDTLVLEKIRPTFTKWLKDINRFIDLQENKNIETTGLVFESAGGFQLIMLVLTVVAIAIGIIVAIIISTSLRRSLGAEPNEAADALSLIATGNLVSDISSLCPNSMMATMSKMQERLRQTVSNIAEASNELNLQASSVSAGSNQIISAAQQQDSLPQKRPIISVTCSQILGWSPNGLQRIKRMLD